MLCRVTGGFAAQRTKESEVCDDLRSGCRTPLRDHPTPLLEALKGHYTEYNNLHSTDARI